jgi:hypothetical protein
LKKLLDAQQSRNTTAALEILTPEERAGFEKMRLAMKESREAKDVFCRAVESRFGKKIPRLPAAADNDDLAKSFPSSPPTVTFASVREASEDRVEVELGNGSESQDNSLVFVRRGGEWLLYHDPAQMDRGIAFFRNMATAYKETAQRVRAGELISYHAALEALNEAQGISR